MTSDSDDCTDAQFALLSRMITRTWENSEGKWYTDLAERRYTYIAELWDREYRLRRSLSTDAECFRQMLQDNNVPWMRDVLRWDFTAYAVSGGMVRIPLAGIELLIDVQDESVQRAIIELLRTVRTEFPYAVDDLLDELDLSPELTAIMRRESSPSGIGDLLSFRAPALYKRAIMRSGSVEFKRTFIWLWSRLPESSSFAEWLTTVLKVTVNLVYGGQVFLDPEFQFAMSRQWLNWEDKIRDLLTRNGRVLAKDLTDVPSQFREHVFSSYLGANPNYDIEMMKSESGSWPKRISRKGGFHGLAADRSGHRNRAGERRVDRAVFHWTAGSNVRSQVYALVIKPILACGFS